MATLTYTQAVIELDNDAAQREKQHQTLKGDIAAFIEAAKDFAYSAAERQDQQTLRDLESQLQSN